MEDHNMQPEDMQTEDHEDFSTEELVEVTEDKVDALINVLIKKGIISEDELQGALEELYEDSDDDDDDDGEDDEETGSSF